MFYTAFQVWYNKRYEVLKDIFKLKNVKSDKMMGCVASSIILNMDDNHLNQ